MTTFRNLPPPPQDRDEILLAVGLQRRQIYDTVRKILDDFEVVARWEQLYYPPTEIEEFLRIQSCLLSLIEEIPYRVSEMSVQILSDAFKDLLGSFPTPILDDDTRQMILELLEPTAAQRATQSTRKIAFEAVDSIPGDAMRDAQKLLLKWMIDRHASEPSLELSGEAFEDSIASFPDDVIDDSMKQILSNVQFYFDGIHEMAAGDIEKLRARIKYFETAEGAHLSAQERVFTCEISADLKGKYTSAIMGAASNLISEGHWNGAEVEPILFPEKAEEFERNDRLVETLKEALESIRRLPEEVPLTDLVAAWQKSRRIDRYALSHLYGFLSNLGKLMKESSRRALYSGDYHQIQIRENRLSNRVNELNMLHNRTWEVLDDTDPMIRDLYPQMVDKAVELAAVLDVELLKKLVGAKTVQVILRIVSLEGEKRKDHDVRLGQESEVDFSTPESQALRAKVPERRQQLIELLYDEDLQTFLELLLGSVLKRASFAVKQRQKRAASVENAAVAEGPAAGEKRPAAAGAPAPPEELVSLDDLSVLDFEILPEPAAEGTPAEISQPSAGEPPPAVAAAGRDGNEEKRRALEKLHRRLEELISATHPHRKSFDLVQQLLTRKGMIPPAMMQSIQPFLEDLTDSVVPQLAAVSAQGDIPITYQSELTQYCRDLSRRDLTPMDMKSGVLTNMEGLMRLLGDIEAATQEVMDTYGSSGGGDLQGSAGGYLSSLE